MSLIVNSILAWRVSNARPKVWPQAPCNIRQARAPVTPTQQESIPDRRNNAQKLSKAALLAARVSAAAVQLVEKLLILFAPGHQQHFWPSETNTWRSRARYK